MAKLLCFVALLVASAILADAAKAPAPAPAHHVHPHGHHAHGKGHPHTQPNHPYHTYNLKVIIHNVADRDVTFKLVIHREDVPVLAKLGQWTAIGPVKVGIEVEELEFVVAVKNTKGKVVTEVFVVKVAEYMKNIEENSSESLVLVASEETLKGEKYLVVKLNITQVLIEKL